MRTPLAYDVQPQPVRNPRQKPYALSVQLTNLFGELRPGDERWVRPFLFVTVRPHTAKTAAHSITGAP